MPSPPTTPAGSSPSPRNQPVDTKPPRIRSGESRATERGCGGGGEGLGGDGTEGVQVFCLSSTWNLNVQIIKITTIYRQKQASLSGGRLDHLHYF